MQHLQSLRSFKRRAQLRSLARLVLKVSHDVLPAAAQAPRRRLCSGPVRDAQSRVGRGVRRADGGCVQGHRVGQLRRTRQAHCAQLPGNRAVRGESCAWERIRHQPNWHHLWWARGPLETTGPAITSSEPLYPHLTTPVGRLPLATARADTQARQAPKRHACRAVATRGRRGQVVLRASGAPAGRPRHVVREPVGVKARRGVVGAWACSLPMRPASTLSCAACSYAHPNAIANAETRTRDGFWFRLPCRPPSRPLLRRFWQRGCTWGS